MDTQRILVLGQAPSKTRDGLPAFSGGKLARLAGLADYAEFCTIFEPRNLLDAWPGYRISGKGDQFPMSLARAAAAEIPIAGRLVIFVGSRVAAAFGFTDYVPCAWVGHEDAVCALLPHPSGLNLWWNAAANQAKAEAFMRDAVTHVTGTCGPVCSLVWVPTYFATRSR